MSLFNKRWRFLMLFTIMISASFSLSGVAAAGADLTVFAAASLSESMTMIAEAYKKVDPNVKIIFNFDSSGTLKTQLEQGADCDIFISAGQKQMDQIDIDSDVSINPKKLDLVLNGTRFNIVSNKVVLIVPKGENRVEVKDFRDLTSGKIELFAMGNSDVPVGQYTAEVLTHLGILETLKSERKISYGSNVKEVLSQVGSGAVDCGAVYSTDAATSDTVEVVAEAPGGSHRPIVYPAAVMKATKNEKLARDFAEFLKGPDSSEIFRKIGFEIPR